MDMEKRYTNSLIDEIKDIQENENFYLSDIFLPDEKWQPREKMIMCGPQALSDSELLSVLINTGIKGKNVSALSCDLLTFINSARESPHIEDLMRLSGIGESKACAIAAMMEFGRRRWGVRGVIIEKPVDVFNMIRHHADSKQECFFSISMNGGHEVLSSRIVTVGLVNRSIVHPREIFADVLQDRAAAICIAHNHPSGNTNPSPADDEVTIKLKNAAGILGINFLDHVIFTRDCYFSYKNSKRMDELGVSVL
ncbi:DNA repair protein RadC [Spirochaetia bacterium]|nr:DNA repair protein RadC [Spirochaetia bacterium]